VLKGVVDNGLQLKTLATSWRSNGTYALGIWATSYLATSLPGLVIQLLFVPSVVIALERERVIPLRYPVNANV
jgi:hypothetical protein